jgi:CHASE2 domain-containing sensor protein
LHRNLTQSRGKDEVNARQTSRKKTRIAKKLTTIASNVNEFLKTVVDPRPLSYEPPKFPGLYWPFPVSGTQTVYLYDAWSMFRFTLLWTLVDVIGIHLIAAMYAMAIQWRNWKLIWITPVVFGVIGGIEALIAGSVVGGV